MICLPEGIPPTKRENKKRTLSTAALRLAARRVLSSSVASLTCITADSPAAASTLEALLSLNTLPHACQPHTNIQRRCHHTHAAASTSAEGCVRTLTTLRNAQWISQWATHTLHFTPVPIESRLSPRGPTCHDPDALVRPARCDLHRHPPDSTPTRVFIFLAPSPLLWADPNLTGNNSRHHPTTDRHCASLHPYLDEGALQLLLE